MYRTDGSPRSGRVAKPEVSRLVREIQEGEGKEERFQALYDYYVPQIIRVFVRRRFGRQDAEDLAQDVMVRVYRRIETFRFQASFDTWMFSIVASTWKNALRSRDALKRKAEEHSLDEVFKREDTDGDAPMEPRAPGKDPLGEALSAERGRRLLSAVDQLPAKMRQTVKLRALGYKYREIADLMGVTIATVKNQLGTGVQRLRSLLGKDLAFSISETDGEVR